ncbi:MAG: hypothetical protein ACYC6M_13280 [Terriglobales bacterium]
MHDPKKTRYTTITWQEYCRLQRDAETLEFLERQHARRRPGQSIRDLVGRALDAKQAMQTILARAVKRLPDQPEPRAAGRDFRPLDWTDG